VVTIISRLVAGRIACDINVSHFAVELSIRGANVANTFYELVEIAIEVTRLFQAHVVQCGALEQVLAKDLRCPYTELSAAQRLSDYVMVRRAANCLVILTPQFGSEVALHSPMARRMSLASGGHYNRSFSCLQACFTVVNREQHCRKGCASQIRSSSEDGRGRWNRIFDRIDRMYRIGRVTGGSAGVGFLTGLTGCTGLVE
jgi:hypothetical protein